MATDEASNTVNSKRIVVIKNGPYSVEGDVPLVIKTQVVSEQVSIAKRVRIECILV